MLADELHKPIKRKFTRRKVESTDVDKIWSADLVDMQNLQKYNSGYRYILNVIDLYSRYVWSVSLKNKTGKSIVEAFSNIIKNGRKPSKLWVDNGTEFYNNTFQKWLYDNNIEMYSTFNEGKAVVIERFNRTLKNKMYKYFTAQNTYTYIDVLQDFINDCNNTEHRSIKMTPTEASKSKDIPMTQPEVNVESKFQVGDRVRISKYKRKVFDKGYTPNWSEEVFTIDGIHYTNPITYILKDYNDEIIEGSFYEQELQKTNQEVYRIDKVIKKDYKKQLALVSWKGYPKEFNSWIPIDDIYSLVSL